MVAPQLVAGMGERLYVAGLNLYRAEQLKQQKKSETGDQNHITCRGCKQGRALKAPGALILAKLCAVAHRFIFRFNLRKNQALILIASSLRGWSGLPPVRI